MLGTSSCILTKQGEKKTPRPLDQLLNPIISYLSDKNILTLVIPKKAIQNSHALIGAFDESGILIPNCC